MNTEDKGLSEVGYKTLPQAIKDWISLLGYKREDITSIRAIYVNPVIFTLTIGDKKIHVRLKTTGKDRRWADKIMEEEQESLVQHVTQVIVKQERAGYHIHL